MDYRALAELVIMALLGLSTLFVAIGFSIRAFLAPTLRDLFGKQPPDTKLLSARLARLEERLDAIDDSLTRIEEKSDFDRKLEGPKAG